MYKNDRKHPIRAIFENYRQCIPESDFLSQHYDTRTIITPHITSHCYQVRRRQHALSNSIARTSLSMRERAMVASMVGTIDGSGSFARPLIERLGRSA